MRFVLLLILFSLTLSAAENVRSFCDSQLKNLPILGAGRVKPLSVHSKENLRWVLGKSFKSEFSYSKLYCLLSLQAFGHPLGFEPTTSIKNSQLRRVLGGDRISYTILQSKFSLIRKMIFSSKGALKRELDDLAHRLRIFQEITSGIDWKVPSGDGKWTSFTDYDQEGSLNEVQLMTDSKLYLANNPKVNIEQIYSIFKLPAVALLVFMVGLVFLVLRKQAAFWIALSGLNLQIIDMGIRSYISGRAPVTNMYETVMFSGMVAVALSLFLFHKRKDNTILAMGVVYNLITLFMMLFADRMLDASIRPLAPVLRSNFWLSIHVTSVTVSYGAFALSWGLANYLLIILGLKKKIDLVYYNSLVCTCMRYGVVFLAAGILTGAIWADYSWGRFWGWDPKETWSLIVMLIYMALLHGRKTLWMDQYKFIVFAALSFMSVLMAWFGVNYILASGLHSYGFSQGGSLFLLLTLILQFMVLFFYLIRGKS